MVKLPLAYLTLIGCAFSKMLPPHVEYLTCPTAIFPVCSKNELSLAKTSLTSPRFFLR